MWYYRPDEWFIKSAKINQNCSHSIFNAIRDQSNNARIAKSQDFIHGTQQNTHKPLFYRIKQTTQQR